MSRIQINQNLKIGVDEILNGISQLSTSELEDFLRKIQLLKVHRMGKTLPKRELQLLEIINITISEKKQNRFNELKVKLENRTLSEKERKELSIIIELVEKVNDERNEALIELSQIRNIPIRQLMEQLGLRPRQDD